MSNAPDLSWPQFAFMRLLWIDGPRPCPEGDMARDLTDHGFIVASWLDEYGQSLFPAHIEGMSEPSRRMRDWKPETRHGQPCFALTMLGISELHSDRADRHWIKVGKSTAG